MRYLGIAIISLIAISTTALGMQCPATNQGVEFTGATTTAECMPFLGFHPSYSVNCYYGENKSKITYNYAPENPTLIKGKWQPGQCTPICNKNGKCSNFCASTDPSQCQWE